MSIISSLTIIILIMLMVALCTSDAHADWDVMSDTWVATDALGRELPGFDECGPPKQNKQIGMFYFLWMGTHGTDGPYDITKILAKNPDNPEWGPEGKFHHWGESELGYYTSDDEYVIRKHCRMLADAGVDMLGMDVTNGCTYTDVYMKLCKIYQQIRDEGGKTPQICFMANAGNVAVAQNLYDDLYSKNLYKDLWFMWNGKPLLMSPFEGLTDELKNFFTVRATWAWSHAGDNPSWWWGDGKDKWTWLDNYPQWYGYSADPKVPEEASVCVAQHATTKIGRSFHDGKQPEHDKYALCPTTAEGLCFTEQWKGVMKINPPLVFVTGWNEWVAGRFPSSGGDPMLGIPQPKGAPLFVDEYTQEYSRDIEPMKGGHTDNYYYQLIANVRKYKGVRRPQPASDPKSIIIDGNFEPWNSVRPEYRDHIGDTEHRNSVGWGEAGTYVNNTGRNDFVRSKVTYDAKNVYFYIETKDDITKYTDPNWMLLFINADQDSKTGWEGYNYLINYKVIDANTTTIMKTDNGWNWEAIGEVSYAVKGNKMELAIPRELLGKPGKSKISFDFKWADNIQKPNDIIEFSISGDSAPDRRFNYRY